ncbi:MAG: cbb3-type cytochrome c oxidase N-terminal domain-containing protein [Bdellovibrio sp.]
MSQNNNENKILNEEERALLLDHNYDGIQEFDFPLPQWWVWTFIGGIVFAIFYATYYHAFGGPSLRDEYKAEMAQVMELKKAAAEKAGGFNDEEYNAWVTANNGPQVGLGVFNENCASCHKEGGLGDIGPNLTDKYWINVTEVTPANLFKVVHDGVEENGMPAWGEVLSKEDIMAAVSYVLTLRNTNAEGGKEPQGEPVE